jgi:hypothetical protein
MDERTVITIPAHGNETVEAVDGFYVCAGIIRARTVPC